MNGVDKKDDPRGDGEESWERRGKAESKRILHRIIITLGLGLGGWPRGNKKRTRQKATNSEIKNCSKGKGRWKKASGSLRHSAGEP